MILKETKGELEMLLGAAFTSVCNAILLVVPMPLTLRYLITYILVTIVEIRIVFTIKTRKDYLKVFILLYSLAFALGGILQWALENLTIVKKRGYSIMTLFAAVLFFYLFMRKVVGTMKENRFKHQCIKDVVISNDSKQIFCRGLVDTGNSLTDPISQKPVLIIQKDEIIKNDVRIAKEKYRVIPYHSIGKKTGILEGFIADEVLVLDKDEQGNVQTIVRKKVVIGIYEGKLSRDDSYQMILHPMF